MTARFPRLDRERRTIEAMVRLYCREQHHEADLCHECRELLDYAVERLQRCPFGESKTTCARCPVHCYRRDLRERVRVVMRYSGPRMLRRHPWMAVRHMIDRLRQRPQER